MHERMPKGFTLIELLVVMAIISILATIGIASLMDTRRDARDAKRFADLSAIRSAMELYMDTYKHYPIPLVASGAGPEISTAVALPGSIFSEINNPLSPTFMSKMVVDPSNLAASGLYYFYDTNESPGVDHRNYVFCFHQEANSGQWFYYYSTGVSGEANNCPTLPAT